MARHRILVAKRPAAVQAKSSTFANNAFASSSSRLNTHVLLGLSMLVLSANARPLDAAGGSGNIGITNLLSGTATEWSNSGKGGFGEQIAESFLKLLHLNGGNSQQPADDSSLTDIVGPADYPTLTDNSVDLADQTRDGSDNQENMFETLINQNPALSFALSVADLMHKMRELFVDIAVLEGEERGIFVGEQSDNLAQDSLLETSADEPSALGLQLQEEQMPIFPSVSVEDDPPMFDLDDVNDNELAVPGQFTPVVKPEDIESKRPQETIFKHLNPAVNPYAALALSSVLATLFVVGIVVGRHYYLSRAGVNVEDEMERGDNTSDQSSGDEEEKMIVQPSTAPVQPPAAPVEESLIEFDEKAVVELDPSTLPTDSAEQAEAKEAMALLIDVANAALASTPAIMKATILDSPKVAHLGTPKAVSNALDSLRIEAIRPRTRPSTPVFTRPESAMGASAPAIAVTTDSDQSRPASPVSGASSFVSAYSHMPKWSIGRAAGRKALGSNQRVLPIPQHLDAFLPISRSTSPVPSMSAVASPALSFATAIEMPPVRQGQGVSFHTPPSRPTSPGFYPQPPGGLEYGDDEGGVQMRSTMLPPAQLTQTALELALMLPATEWIFQFIVVFIGWFGFWMRPVNTGRRV